MTNFATCSNKGFRITFANGVTVSVQWGPMNYCSVRNIQPGQWNIAMQKDAWESEDAEVAAWAAESGEPWLTRQIWEKNTGEKLPDDVIGHLSSDQVLTFMNWAAAWDEVKPASNEV